jgi:hypothetical protein
VPIVLKSGSLNFLKPSGPVKACNGTANWSHWNSNEKLKEKLERYTGKHSTESQQQTAILGTSHVIRKVLKCETKYLSVGGYRWFKRNTRKKRPVT